MANIVRDTLRVCAAASTLATTIREKQIGFETDTFKLVFKAPGGSHYDYTAEGEPSYHSYLSLDEYLYHYGDADTYYRLRPDRLSGVAGGITFYDFIEDTQDVISFNPDQGDMDFIVNTLSLEALNIAGDTGIPYFKGTEFVLGGVTPTTGDWKYVKSGTSLLLQEYGGASWATKATFIP